MGTSVIPRRVHKQRRFNWRDGGRELFQPLTRLKSGTCETKICYFPLRRNGICFTINKGWMRRVTTGGSHSAFLMKCLFSCKFVQQLTYTRSTQKNWVRKTRFQNVDITLSFPPGLWLSFNIFSPPLDYLHVLLFGLRYGMKIIPWKPVCKFSVCLKRTQIRWDFSWVQVISYRGLKFFFLNKIKPLSNFQFWLSLFSFLFTKPFVCRPIQSTLLSSQLSLFHTASVCPTTWLTSLFLLSPIPWLTLSCFLFLTTHSFSIFYSYFILPEYFNFSPSVPLHVILVVLIHSTCLLSTNLLFRAQQLSFLPLPHFRLNLSCTYNTFCCLTYSCWTHKIE